MAAPPTPTNAQTAQQAGQDQQAPAATTETSTTTGANARATPQNIDDLAAIIMSEASVGNAVERRAVGSTVLNRMQRNATSTVRDVWRAYAHGQQPTQEIHDLAEDLLQGHGTDPTGGATHYYSPRSMPRETTTPADLQNYDIGGGLEQTEGVQGRNYRPTWASQWTETTVQGVRQRNYRFYRAPGNGTVR